MDEQTERMLRPQIMNEAFAHQVVDMIHQVNRRQNALLAESEALLASPDAEEASVRCVAYIYLFIYLLFVLNKTLLMFVALGTNG